MKNLTTLVFGLFLSLPLLRGIDASVSYATFFSPEGSYVEVYLHVVGETVVFHPLTDSTGQSNLDVVILFKRGEEIVKLRLRFELGEGALVGRIAKGGDIDQDLQQPGP